MFICCFSLHRTATPTQIIFGQNWIGPYTSDPAGHDNATWTKITDFLERCGAIGVGVHYALNSIAPLPDTPEKWKILSEEVNRVKSYSSIKAYYLADEPDGQGISPKVLADTADYIRHNLDASRPLSMVFNTAEGPAKYESTADILMVDPYPSK